MTILEQMKNKKKFTDTELEVIQYLLNNPDKIEKLTINQLAKITFTSNSTIIRVCNKLHLKGFRELKIKLLKELESNKFIKNSIDYSMPFQKEDEETLIINNIYSLYIDSINLIQSRLDIKELNKMVDILCRSNRIFIYALGDSKLTVKSFINKLVKYDMYPIITTDNGEELYISQNATKKDCALFVSYSATTGQYEKCIRILSERNVPTLLITANEKAMVTMWSDYKLIIPDVEQENKIATFYSQLAFKYILSLMLALIYKKKNGKEA